MATMPVAEKVEPNSGMKVGHIKQLLNFNTCSNEENLRCRLLGLFAFIAMVIPAVADDKKDVVDTAAGTGNSRPSSPRSRPRPGGHAQG